MTLLQLAGLVALVAPAARAGAVLVVSVVRAAAELVAQVATSQLQTTLRSQPSPTAAMASWLMQPAAPTRAALTARAVLVLVGAAVLEARAETPGMLRPLTPLERPRRSEDSVAVAGQVEKEEPALAGSVERAAPATAAIPGRLTSPISAPSRLLAT